VTVVGVRQLKDSLSRYLRLVAGGEMVLVTDRGRVVAELRRPGTETVQALDEEALALLARQGLLASGAFNSPDAYPLLDPLLPAGSAAELLAEERGEP
jgi:antitoxin (DNA-binding transcriptional repressor) of toxin-antitoxin stability system